MSPLETIGTSSPNLFHSQTDKSSERDSPDTPIPSTPSTLSTAAAYHHSKRKYPYSNSLDDHGGKIDWSSSTSQATTTSQPPSIMTFSVPTPHALSAVDSTTPSSSHSNLESPVIPLSAHSSSTDSDVTIRQRPTTAFRSPLVASPLRLALQDPTASRPLQQASPQQVSAQGESSQQASPQHVPDSGQETPIASVFGLTLTEGMARLASVDDGESTDRRPNTASTAPTLSTRRSPARVVPPRLDVSDSFYRPRDGHGSDFPSTPRLEGLMARTDAHDGSDFLPAAGSSSTGGGLFSLASSSGRSTPCLPPCVRPTSHYISAQQVAQRLEQPSLGPNTIVIDMRPLKQHLDCRLAGSVNLVVPSLILRRCKRNALAALRESTSVPPHLTTNTRSQLDKSSSSSHNPSDDGGVRGSILPGGWEAMSSFVTTAQGRSVWDDTWANWQQGGTDATLEIVLIPQHEDQDSARVVEEILLDLIKQEPSSKRNSGQVSIKWLQDGWVPGTTPSCWQNVLECGDSSRCHVDNDAPHHGVTASSAKRRGRPPAPQGLSLIHI